MCQGLTEQEEQEGQEGQNIFGGLIFLVLSLAYRIASMPVVLPNPGVLGLPYDEGALTERLKAEVALIARCPHLRFGNVAEFYAAHDRQEWSVTEDIPNWAPPFRHFFAEWEEPSTWVMPGGEIKKAGGGQQGWFVLSANVTEETKGDIDSWSFLISAQTGIKDAASHLRDYLAQYLPETRWVLCCHLWQAVFAQPACGKPLWPGCSTFLFVRSDGHCLGYVLGGIGVNYFQSIDSNALPSLLNILGLGISFCHCKNVIRAEHEDDRGDRWHRRTGVPKLTFYTLDINPMRETLRREGNSDGLGIKRALHICRGHFATYSPEHPLFGKYVGTYWRPDHVRGSKDQGEVHKKYKVSIGDNEGER